MELGSGSRYCLPYCQAARPATARHCARGSVPTRASWCPAVLHLPCASCALCTAGAPRRWRRCCAHRHRGRRSWSARRPTCCSSGCGANRGSSTICSSWRWVVLASRLGCLVRALNEAASRKSLLRRLKLALNGTATVHGLAAVCPLCYVTYGSLLFAHAPQDSGLQPRQAFISTVVMDALAFATRYPEFEEWQQQRAAAAVAPNGLPLPRPRPAWADPPPYANDDYDGELYDKAEVYDKGDSGDGASTLDGQASGAAGSAAAAAAAAGRNGKGAAPKRKRGPRKAAAGAMGKAGEAAAAAAASAAHQAGPASPKRRGSRRRGLAKAAEVAGGGSGGADASKAAAAGAALPVPQPLPAQAAPPLPLPLRQQVVRQPSGSSIEPVA